MRASYILLGAKIVRAAPCSIIGLALAAPFGLLGASARMSSGTIEIHCAPTWQSAARWNAHFRIVQSLLVMSSLLLLRKNLHGSAGMNGFASNSMNRWGLAFFLAYAVSGVWQLPSGRSPYWDNHFEVQARLVDDKH